ncbi:RNA ligase family protein [Streptomyces sp. NPDC048157]|uniref:RNA ligase family protein n=1 Tax=Streptomyces sp. NPDC048157 TaxID=3365503 RepID=UPI0037229AA8
MHQFVEWPKTRRLFRDIVITEKLDGTNSAVHISAFDNHAPKPYPEDSYTAVVGGTRYIVTAQSRKRIITPGKTTDNYNFAEWVYDNAADLVRILGEGLHFGEWWGQGIQRRYGMGEKRFSLFNADRYQETNARVGTAIVESVPVMYRGTFNEGAVTAALNKLSRFGSVAAPGFMNPEGICVYHSQTRSVFKVTLDNNDAGKWEAA